MRKRQYKQILKISFRVEKARYCSYCGAEMVYRIVGAEKITDCDGFPIFDRYNRETGKRQQTREWRCPAAAIRLFTQHDWYEDGFPIKQ